MMRLARSFLLGGLLAVVGVLAAQPVFAQTQPPPKPPDYDTWEKNILRKFNQQARRQLEDLARGGTQPTRDDDVVIDLGAQYFAYFLANREAEPVGMIHGHFNELDKLLAAAQAGRPTTDRFLDLFVSRTATYARSVLFASNTELTHEMLARINEARLVARLAETGRDEPVALLAEVLEARDSKGQYRFNDGALYWAAHGLHSAFDLAFSKTPPVLLKDQKLQQRAVLDLLNLLARPIPGLVTMQPDQIAGQQIFRREVIRALGSSRYPAVPDEKDPKRGRTALALAMVVRNINLTLPARWDERLEAAIGLTRMQPQLDKQYRPDVAAFHVGAFVVEYAKTYQDLPDNETTKNRKDQMQLDAIRLGDALRLMSQNLEKNDKDLKANWKDDELKAIQAYVKQVSDASYTLLTSIRGGNTELLGNLLNTPPKSMEVFQGQADSVLRPQAPKEPASEEPEKP